MRQNRFVPPKEIPERSFEAVENEATMLRAKVDRLRDRRGAVRSLEQAKKEERELHEAQKQFLDVSITALQQKKEQGTITDAEHALLAKYEWGRDELIAREQTPQFKHQVLPKQAYEMDAKWRQEERKGMPVVQGAPIKDRPAIHLMPEGVTQDVSDESPATKVGIPQPNAKPTFTSADALPSLSEPSGLSQEDVARFDEKIADFQARKAQIEAERAAKPTVNRAEQDVASLRDDEIEPIPLPSDVAESVAEEEQEQLAEAQAAIEDAPTIQDAGPDFSPSVESVPAEVDDMPTVADIEEHRDTIPGALPPDMLDEQSAPGKKFA